MSDIVVRGITGMTVSKVRMKVRNAVDLGCVDVQDLDCIPCTPGDGDGTYTCCDRDTPLPNVLWVQWFTSVTGDLAPYEVTPLPRVTTLTRQFTDIPVHPPSAPPYTISVAFYPKGIWVQDVPSRFFNPLQPELGDTYVKVVMEEGCRVVVWHCDVDGTLSFPILSPSIQYGATPISFNCDPWVAASYRGLNPDDYYTWHVITERNPLIDGLLPYANAEGFPQWVPCVPYEEHWLGGTAPQFALPRLQWVLISNATGFFGDRVILGNPIPLPFIPCGGNYRWYGQGTAIGTDFEGNEYIQENRVELLCGPSDGECGGMRLRLSIKGFYDAEPAYFDETDSTIEVLECEVEESTGRHDFKLRYTHSLGVLDLTFSTLLG